MYGCLEMYVLRDVCMVVLRDVCMVVLRCMS